MNIAMISLDDELLRDRSGESHDSQTRYAQGGGAIPGHRPAIAFVCPFDLWRQTGTPIRARLTVETARRRWPCHVISLGSFAGHHHDRGSVSAT